MPSSNSATIGPTRASDCADILRKRAPPPFRATSVVKAPIPAERPHPPVANPTPAPVPVKIPISASWCNPPPKRRRRPAIRHSDICQKRTHPEPKSEHPPEIADRKPRVSGGDCTPLSHRAGGASWPPVTHRRNKSGPGAASVMIDILRRLASPRRCWRLKNFLAQSGNRRRVTVLSAAFWRRRAIRSSALT